MALILILLGGDVAGRRALDNSDVLHNGGGGTPHDLRDCLSCLCAADHTFVERRLICDDRIGIVGAARVAAAAAIAAREGIGDLLDPGVDMYGKHLGGNA